MRRAPHWLLALACICTLAATPAFADSLRGHVVDDQGHAVRNAQVFVFRGLALATTIRADRQTGAYGPVQLNSGTYDILAVAAGYTAQPVTVTLGSSTQPRDLDLVMTESAASDYVVVTGTTPGTDGLPGMTRGVTVFDRGEVLRLQASSLADLLQLAPGLLVSSQNGSSAVTAWGGTANDVLVMIDGVPQQMFGGTFNAALISAADIEHVDIIRGAGSVEDTVRAASAIVHVHTVPDSGTRAMVLAEGGLEPSGRFAASLGQGDGDWTWRANGEWLGTRGQQGRRTDSGASVSNDDTTRLNGALTLAWQDQPNRSVRWFARARRTTQGLSGPWGRDPLGVSPGVDLVSRASGTTASTGVSIVLPTENYTHRVDVSFTRASAATTGTRDERLLTDRLLAQYHFDVRLAGLGQISAGGRREWESATDSLVTNAEGADVTQARSFTSWFVEGRRAFGLRVNVSGGARLDIVDRAALEGNTSAAAYRPALLRDVQYQVNARGNLAALLYRNGRGTSVTLRAMAGTTTRPPTAEDVGFSENASLRPERSKMASAGFDMSAAGSQLAITADAFHYRFNDLIVAFATQRRGVRRIATDNVAIADANGATIAATLTLPWHLSARSSLTWLDTRVVQAHCWCGDAPDLLPIGDESALVRRPPFAGAANLMWAWRGHSAFVSVNGRSHMLDIEPTAGAALFDNPGALTITAGATMAIGRVELFVRGTNLLDRTYEDILGYPAPRRAVVAGLRLSARD